MAVRGQGLAVEGVGGLWSDITRKPVDALCNLIVLMEGLVHGSR